jgi:hypothetical protein
MLATSNLNQLALLNLIPPHSFPDFAMSVAMAHSFAEASALRLDAFNFGYRFEDGVRLLGDNGVSKCAQSVHPLGNPISQTTHSGFNAPEVRPSALHTIVVRLSCVPFFPRLLS